MRKMHCRNVELKIVFEPEKFERNFYFSRFFPLFTSGILKPGKHSRLAFPHLVHRKRGHVDHLGPLHHHGHVEVEVIPQVTQEVIHRPGVRGLDPGLRPQRVGEPPGGGADPGHRNRI